MTGESDGSFVNCCCCCCLNEEEDEDVDEEEEDEAPPLDVENDDVTMLF